MLSVSCCRQFGRSTRARAVVNNYRPQTESLKTLSIIGRSRSQRVGRGYTTPTTPTVVSPTSTPCTSHGSTRHAVSKTSSRNLHCLCSSFSGGRRRCLEGIGRRCFSLDTTFFQPEQQSDSPVAGGPTEQQLAADLIERAAQGTGADELSGRRCVITQFAESELIVWQN